MSALAATVCWLLALTAFFPGHLTSDSVSQLEQATGVKPLADWHPPVMSLLWQALIALTGSPGALLAVQLFAIWAALGLSAWAVWGLTGRWQGGAAVFAVGFTPQVLTFSGVMWKDVQMATALLCATALALAAMQSPPRRPVTRWALLACGALLLAYAVLVRKNAFFAVPPVLVMLVFALWPRPRRITWVLASAALVAAIVVPSTAITLFAKPLATHQSAQIMLDDVLLVMPRTALREAAVSPALRDRLVKSSALCESRKQLSDTVWNCWGDGPSMASAHRELQNLWINGVLRERPVGYLQYRAQLFSTLLFRARNHTVTGRDRDEVGIVIAHPRMGAMVNTYVEGVARTVPMLFQGWFWLLTGTLLALRPGHGPFRRPVRLLGVSAVLYILGYLPIMPATDFRYVYWSAIAATLGAVLWLLGRHTATAPAEADHSQETRPADPPPRPRELIHS
ncbi:hypothetical protein [Streptomyces sp. NPDC051561]|uniref:hypothetical protein n=1 Tax=Streptomyces sp. NPDC051561 TaxID=3365658 RepID=UPI00378EFE94